MKIIKTQGKEFQKIVNRYLCRKKNIQERVARIIEDVRSNGDEALLKYTRKFDKVKITPKQLKVSSSEVSAAYHNISPEFVSNMKIVFENIEKFYRRQIKKPWRTKEQDGVVLGEKFQPLDRVGVYIPAGTAPLVSSVYMTVLPARIAGVKNIVVVTPPDKTGNINPYILVMADLLKVTEIYKVGGAHAIAALTFGTKIIPRVDKIIGPGNIYVTEAKRQVFGFVDIDMLAGPTELVIIANRYSPVNFVVADLLSQAEHAGGLSILITTSKALAKQVKVLVPKGYIIVAKNLDEATFVANQIAPEHLQILVRNPSKILKNIHNAAAVFLGPYSPASVGDYVAGPSHVLPTLGTARFFSGIGLNDFIKSIHVISYSKKALEKIKEPLEKVSSIEGLSKHLDSLKVRFQS